MRKLQNLRNDNIPSIVSFESVTRKSKEGGNEMASSLGVRIRELDENKRHNQATEKLTAANLDETIRNNKAVIRKDYAALDQKEKQALREFSNEAFRVLEQAQHNRITEQQARDELDSLNTRAANQLSNEYKIALLNNGKVKIAGQEFNLAALTELGYSGIQDLLTAAGAGTELTFINNSDTPTDLDQGQIVETGTRVKNKKTGKYVPISVPSNATRKEGKDERIVEENEQAEDFSSSRGPGETRTSGGSVSRNTISTAVDAGTTNTRTSSGPGENIKESSNSGPAKIIYSNGREKSVGPLVN